LRGHTPNAAESEYRGFRIEKIERAIQMGHDIARTSGNKRPKTRSVGVQYLIHYEDGGSKTVSTMRAAREYIDNYLGPEHTPNAPGGYYVWVLLSDGTPKDGEGPYGPMDFIPAKDFARIGATEGAHDRAVSIGLNPDAPSFDIVRHYRRGTGERIR